MRPPHLLIPFLLFALISCQEPDASSGSQPAESTLLATGTPLAHTTNILSFGPRPAGSPAAARVRAYVTSVLTDAGWTVGSQTFESQTPIGVRSFTNLIARFPSQPDSDPWKQRVEGILCAHLDSKLMPRERFLGADDAASACGLILSMAQEMAANPAKASRLELVFFDGEEAFTRDMGPKPGGIFDGLYGSTRYAARWRGVSAKPTFGILLDMVGHQDLSIKVPSDSPPELFRLMRKKAVENGHGKRFGMANGEIWDDHVPLNAAGIPTIDLIGDFQSSDWWHTPKDNLDLISEESLDITRTVVTAMLAELLADPSE